jgi:hypothetical protein
VAETYFAGIIGMTSVDVAAEAEAECGCGMPCDVFPLSFDLPTWEQIPCGTDFYVWDDDRVDEDTCTTCDCEGVAADEDGNPLPYPLLSTNTIGPGHRGWLRLDDPGEEWNAAGCGNDCGDAALRCWILNGFGAAVDEDCVPGKTGVDNAAVNAVANRVGDEVNILIWDPNDPCTSSHSVFGDCPGTLYHIVDYGRVEILDVLRLSLDCDPDDPDCLPSDCPKNVKVIHGRVVCKSTFEPCSPLTGSGPNCPGGFWAAALIR